MYMFGQTCVVNVMSYLSKASGAMGGGGSNVPHVKLADPDEATYWGRVQKTFHMLDFRTALTSDHALQDALALVAAKGACSSSPVWRFDCPSICDAA